MDDPETETFDSWSAFWHAVRTHPLAYLGHRTRTLFQTLGQGKGLRSRMIYHVAQACGAVTSHHVAFASAVECIHTASLCHDDVIDNANVRRNKACLHRTHNGTHAILLGDGLVAQGFGILAHLPHPAIMSLACDCLSCLVEGQVAERTIGPHSGQDEYIHMVTQKTGSLFGLAVQGAGLLSGSDPEKAVQCHASGCHFGIAYQLRDDCAEYTQPAAQWSTGHDCLEKKWTLPLLHARQKHPATIDALLHDLWADPCNVQKRQDLMHIVYPSVNCVHTLAQEYEERSGLSWTHLGTSLT